MFRLNMNIPFSYVETSVAKLATFCNEWYSSSPVSSNVRTRDCNRSAQNLEQIPFGKIGNTSSDVNVTHRRGRRSMKVISFKC